MAKLEISKVHDAYAAGGECPLCTLMDGAEKTYLASFRGARVMEPTVRVRTNETGFCPRHYARLYEGENKLGLGLLVHTHLAQSLPRLRRMLEAARETGKRGSLRRKELARGLAEFRDSCFICDMLAEDLRRYAFTIAYLWKNDPAFGGTFRSSRGFCLGHFSAALQAAEAELGGDALSRWTDEAVTLMTGSLERLEREVLAFTRFLHGSVRELGGTEERTALARALQVLAGRIMSLE
jgi:hypothetical protein